MADRATVTLTYPGLDPDGNTIAVTQTTEVTLAEDNDNPAAIIAIRPIEGGTQQIEIGVNITNVAPVFYVEGARP